MMKTRVQANEYLSLLFGLKDKNVQYRVTARLIAFFGIIIILGLITMGVAGDQILTTEQRLGVVAWSFIKYPLLMYAIYKVTITRAANYLADIFELKDVSIAEGFIEEVAFGAGDESITINEGKVSEKDEASPIILIGGPGKIKVNLGSAALLEQLDGDPEVIHAQKDLWELECFERIREIGKEDQVGKREYAAINLHDQFVTELEVASRTKDGFPIEAKDIKILFSIQRNPNQFYTKNTIVDPYSFDERAVQKLVYNQIVLTYNESLMSQPSQKKSVISFPWDTTVIPLVLHKLDKIIMENTLSQILATISQQELDMLTENEQTIKKIQVELTGEMTRANISTLKQLPQFKSRTAITQEFFEKTFTDEAEKYGVTVHWIDVGTWNLPHGIVVDNLKSAWALSQNNASKRNEIENSKKQFELEGFLDVINQTIVENFEKSSYGFRLTDKEYDEIIKYTEKGEMKIDRLLQQETKPVSASAKKSLEIAREILRAFRREFLYIKEQNKKEDLSLLEQEEVTRLDKAIQDIELFIFRKVK